MNGSININGEMEYMISKLREICDAEDVTAPTKVDALKTLGHVVELAVNINMNAIMMEMRNSDDRK